MNLDNDMTYEEVMSAVRHLVRVTSLFNTYRDTLVDTCFAAPEKGIYFGEDYEELPLLLIWKGLKLYYEEQTATEAPSRSQMEHYIREVIRREVPIDEALKERLLVSTDPNYGFLAYMFAPGDYNLQSGVPLLRDFLQERLVVNELSSIVTFSGHDDGSVTDKLERLSDRAQRINTLGYSYEASPMLPEQSFYDTLPDDPAIRTTGITWLDESLNGGQRRGDCYAIMGVTGAGKTTLAIQVAVEGARAAFAEAPDGEEPEKVLYYTIEENASSQMPKFTSYGANLRRNSVSISRDSREGLLNPSTDPAMPKDYEAELWPQAATRSSEWERFQEFKRIANKTLYIRNFSGIPDIGDTDEVAKAKRQLGFGGIREIYEDARRIHEATGCGIRSIFIDYVGLVCSRMSDRQNYDDKLFYNMLRSVGDECRVLLAGNLDCTVWVCHQLSGVACGATPIRMPTSADSSGCKSFVNNMAAAWALGVPDRSPKANHGGPCVYLSAVKQRYSGCTAAGGGMILQHDRYINRLNNVTNSFRADPSRCIFVPRHDAN